MNGETIIFNQTTGSMKIIPAHEHKLKAVPSYYGYGNPPSRICEVCGITEEAINARKREIEQAKEFKDAKRKLGTKGRKIHDCLDTMIGNLEKAGVDVSHFPHAAYMELIRAAKEIALIE